MFVPGRGGVLPTNEKRDERACSLGRGSPDRWPSLSLQDTSRLPGLGEGVATTSR